MYPEPNSKCLECLAKSECKLVLTSAYKSFSEMTEYIKKYDEFYLYTGNKKSWGCTYAFYTPY